MLIIKKKNVLQELAVSLFLMLEFNPDTTAASLITRIRERAREALKAASLYTGALGSKEAQAFLETKPLHFSIDCRGDLVKGDFIRFTEYVYDNRKKPSRHLGKRGLVAEVLNIRATGNSPMVQMRVVSCGGVWVLPAGTEIFRTLKAIQRMEVMRAPWDDEEKRNESV